MASPSSREFNGKNEIVHWLRHIRMASAAQSWTDMSEPLNANLILAVTLP